MKAILLGALLLTAGITMLPQASAACEPNPITNPDYCDGEVSDVIDFLVRQECWDAPGPFGRFCWAP
ncbi:MAG TPA: hypothetical protein VFH78_15000 [Candidatus Thermoplasmatota archaeon]|nr:hypothetical protein [Candidatus Thermoplasmatota archaeon]